MAITGLGNSYKQQAIMGMRDVASMENQRETANKSLAEQRKQSQIATATTGAVVGGMAGASSAAMGAKFGSAAGPVGFVAGAVGGYLISSLF
jgi:outer membrane lipoprotein SlyB